MTAPQPIAQGSLDKTPLAHVFLSLGAKKLDGTLVVWRDDGGAGQDRVRFVQGVPTRARLLEPAQTLVRGLLPLFARTAPYAFYGEDLVGEVGVEGEVDVWALIMGALRGGARKDAWDRILGAHGDQKLRVRSGTSLGRFEFNSKEHAFLEVLRAEPASVGALVGAAADPRVPKRVLYALTITQCLETFEGEFQRTSLTEVARGVGERFSEVTKEMQAEAARRRKRDSVESGEDFGLPGLPGLPSDMPPPPSSGSARRPSGSSGPAPGQRATHEDLPPAPPPGLSDEDRKRWESIADFAARMDDMNYFEMLEIEQSASEQAVQEAYFKRIKAFHPDRLGPDLQAIKPWADRIFHHLTEAQKTLADTDTRGTYLKTVQGGGGTPRADRKLSDVLSAAMEFQKVEVLVRRKDYAGALKLLEPLMELAPEESDYPAMKGLILFRMHGTAQKAHVDMALACIEDALKLYDRSERALLTKAQILQRTGKHAEAIALFRQVVEINPKNVDAQRQVRLAEMRGDSGEGAKDKKKDKKKKDEGGGLFSKFFGKKK